MLFLYNINVHGVAFQNTVEILKQKITQKPNYNKKQILF